ncbi:Metallophosphoesterase MPPED2 [Hondaea fermentalgiana]|uniref:Metallophosphoesterase MPPED2 n=1 Tax=Hondaea fermentalgiana TaxID=2315210 RepID=A0A2R5GD86_9STRA|nr:Metallophosphoesterase MPPED2 [Hondaea fermentalgiana]|eukprot:GBG28936.1 Metallophosphoesterase MPPED2 [Hondaea fermentalgiana]
MAATLRARKAPSRGAAAAIGALMLLCCLALAGWRGAHSRRGSDQGGAAAAGDGALLLAVDTAYTKRRERAVSVVCLGDTHGRHEEISVPDADILVYTGDAVDPHDDTKVRDQLRGFNAWLGTLKHKHKIFVAGNHDAERDIHLEDLRAILTNAVYLQDEMLEVNVAGSADPVRIYGSPWQPQWDGFETFRPAGSALANTFAAIPARGLDILATHSPPRGYFDTDPDGNPIGSKDLLLAAERVSPALHCFGHVHAGRTADMMASQKHNAEPITYVNGAICNDDLEAVWDPVRILL